MASTDTDDVDNLSNTSNPMWKHPCQAEMQLVSSDNGCNASYDGISCWPTSKPGTLVVIPCFAEFNGIRYDVTENATRLCFSNGTWERNSNYSNCKPAHHFHDIPLDEWDVSNHTIVIYFIGYSLSLAALLVALLIFVCFKNLRCLKNTFHANLMFTYVLVNVTWILTATSHSATNKTCTCVLIIFLYYFKGTNFFWMFVEGFYLYIAVVKTFHVGNVKFYIYMLIGWGIPAIVVATWVAVKAELVVDDNQGQEPTLGPIANDCPWIQGHNYDFIFICPILLVLLINVLFLLKIVWVLITKLRVSTPESQQYRYRKATKALLVLIPLLGVTYILFLTAPETGIWSAIFAYVRSILLSTQGFTVSVLYCFLNNEVRQTLRRHWTRWREKQSLGYDSRMSLRSFHDSTLTQSVRLNSIGRNDRESVSYVTNTTYVGNGYSRVDTNELKDVTAV